MQWLIPLSTLQSWGHCVAFCQVINLWLCVLCLCHAVVDSFVNFAELGPDWDMLSRGLFISCLMDAAEHDKSQVKVRAHSQHSQ
jgi:hypothetical protein